jgi:hypothetical protein
MGQDGLIRLEQYDGLETFLRCLRASSNFFFNHMQKMVSRLAIKAGTRRRFLHFIWQINCKKPEPRLGQTIEFIVAEFAL